MKAEAPETRFMRRALRLASKGLGRASPNPVVGAVVVKEGRIVGEGFHRYDLLDHAEVVALRKAGENARGSDLYVTLEPCAHSGRTPPCCRSIAEAGVRRTFVAVEDPNPLVSGAGVAYLRSRAVEVLVGLCRDEAAEMNRAFFHYIGTQRPYVTLKLALSLDGKIATRTGESKWITGPRSRRRVHRMRHRADAVLVGVGTILADNPSLDVRGHRRSRITKVVLDSRLRCPQQALIFLSGDPVVIFHGSHANEAARSALEKRARLIEVASDGSGLAWRSLLAELGRLKVLDLLVEGGSRVAASALSAGVVNRIAFFYGPCVIGGEGLSGVGDLGIDRLDECLRFSAVRVRRLGPDLLVEAVPTSPREESPVDVAGF
jgi:diaminohydroxyphosphoribosylaminopyrimidine deaminase / 5-amino-6-(5-phosphoribosylamino)uracil reductase